MSEMQTQQSNIEYILPSSTSTARGKGHWIGNIHTVNPKRSERLRGDENITYSTEGAQILRERTQKLTTHTYGIISIDAPRVKYTDGDSKEAPFHQHFQEFLRIF